MRSPTIHLNGTGKVTLTNQYRVMIEAIRDAHKVLQNNGPHARDYYVQDPEAYAEAAQQHMDRMLALSKIEKELTEIAKNVSKQR